MNKLEIKYGLIIGFGVILWTLAEFALGFHTDKLAIGEYSGFFSSIIPIIAIYFYLKERQQGQKNKIMSFKSLLGPAFILFLIPAILISVFFLIYHQWIHPDFINLGLDYTAEKLNSQGMSEEEINQTIESLKEFYKPGTQTTMIMAGILLQGYILLFIENAILNFQTKRKNS